MLGCTRTFMPISSVLAMKIVQSHSFYVADPKVDFGFKLLKRNSPSVIPRKLRASMGLCCTQLYNGKKVVS